MKRPESIIKVMLFAVCLVVFAGSVNAQEEESSSVSFGADLVSRYIWRGVNLGGNTPSVQPGIEWSVGSSGLAVGAWGAYSIGGQFMQEADLYASYTLPNEMFSLGITDYYFPTEDMGYKYFDYGSDTTGHIFEAMLSFNGTDKIPISVMFAMNIAGADDDNSKYLEIGYSKTLKDIELSAFLGMALDDSGFYGQESAGLVNVGIGLGKEIAITDKFSLPASASLVCNPATESIYMVFGFSF